MTVDDLMELVRQAALNSQQKADEEKAAEILAEIKMRLLFPDRETHSARFILEIAAQRDRYRKALEDIEKTAQAEQNGKLAAADLWYALGVLRGIAQIALAEGERG